MIMAKAACPRKTRKARKESITHKVFSCSHTLRGNAVKARCAANHDLRPAYTGRSASCTAFPRSAWERVSIHKALDDCLKIELIVPMLRVGMQYEPLCGSGRRSVHHWVMIYAPEGTRSVGTIRIPQDTVIYD